MDDDLTSDASGIFTTNSASLASQKKTVNDDDSVEIVSAFPSLDDDDSAIISDEGAMSGVSSGIYTGNQQSQTTGQLGMLSTSTPENTNPFDYDLENSASDDQTDQVLGHYGKLLDQKPSTPPAEKKTTSWLQDTFQKFGLQINTMPTASSSPDTSPAEKKSPRDAEDPKNVTHETIAIGRELKDEDDDGVAAVVASPGAQEVEQSKICGMSVSRIIMISSLLVVVALAVVIAAVATGNGDDGDDGSSKGTGINLQDILTPKPTQAPTIATGMPVTTPLDCPPDNDDVSFQIASNTVNCTWFRDREQVFIEIICEDMPDVADICRTSCKNCEMNEPSASPVTSGPTVTPSTSLPTTSMPTIFGFTQFPTAPTDPPTLGPTNSPTDLPTSGPTNGPTTTPTVFPTLNPTPRPTGFPTLGPTLGPTSSTQFPTTLSGPLSIPPTTASPTPRPTPRPTAVPTVTANCEPDFPGPIPDFPGTLTCAWLAQTNESYRNGQCQPGRPAFIHCQTTCRSCLDE